MNVVIASDRSGFPMKRKLLTFLNSLGYTLIDVGTFDAESQCPFPIGAQLVTAKILSGEAERGIMSCGSGIGAHIAANKVPGIRAALVHDILTARECVEQLDATVMCFGGEIIGETMVYTLAQRFLQARFKDDTASKALVAKIEGLDP
jgi:ribose 5-phosphate isomerase B